MSFVLRDVTIKLITLYFLPESVIKSCNERPYVWKLAKSVLMSDDGEGSPSFASSNPALVESRRPKSTSQLGPPVYNTKFISSYKSSLGPLESLAIQALLHGMDCYS